MTALLANEDIRIGQYLLWQAAPTLLVVCLVVGSALLWLRTRRGSAVAQLGSATILLLATILQHVMNLGVPIESRLSSRFWRTANELQSAGFIVGIVIFSLAYLWYAVGHKRI